MKMFCLLAFMLFSLSPQAQMTVYDHTVSGSFGLVSKSNATSIYVDEADHEVVKKAAAMLQSDIQMVTGQRPSIVSSLSGITNAVIIGSLDKSSLIRQLAKVKKLRIDKIKGKWEAYQLQIVKQPTSGIASALVIIGSDRRAVAYGVLELSKQIGVSPWYWWADVPPKKRKEIFVSVSAKAIDQPKVKYRGIFINDEAPALSSWSKEQFGGFNHRFYEKVFELILRLKGNYLWPAMWGNAFYDDDSLNRKTADDYAIVIGTSHHEPLMRAHDEWRRYGKGKWDYDSNEVRLKEFWRQGMQRATNEKIVSIGMRGDGDAPMSRETATALLERIVKDQRQIIAEVTGKPATETPQLWALYKEVQDYYDKGMRVPDDVTLLLCDDNWGNIRRLPKLTDRPRRGGYGIYYHFDYVGGPRNYKWINTNPLPRTWEQMHLAYQYGVQDIWIVNVGDIKPMELPISFFLDYAWNPERLKAEDIDSYTKEWAAAQFGIEHAAEIGELLKRYAKYNGRRKPELLDAQTYHLHNYNEAETITAAWDSLVKKAEQIQQLLAPEFSDAYFQLVLHPIKASANLQHLYTVIARNHAAAAQHSLVANEFAEQAKQLYANDSLITEQYQKIAGGKWNHMMSQTHIGYTYWQQPEKQQMPSVSYVTTLDTVTGLLLPGAYPPKMAAHPGAAKGLHLFYELNGYLSIDAEHFSRAIGSKTISWKVLPDHGRTGASVTAFPVTASAVKLTANSPHIEYDCYLYHTGTVKLTLYFSPTLNFHHKDKGLQYAVSVDREQPTLLSLNKDDSNTRTWEKWVSENIIKKSSAHYMHKPGKHTVKFWLIDTGIVLQKLVMDLGGLEESYLGPPETMAR